MRKNEIVVGGHYKAKVSNRIVTVRVDSIVHNSPIPYKVTNLDTGRRTQFRSAAKFRSPVKNLADTYPDVPTYSNRIKKPSMTRSKTAPEKTLTLAQAARQLRKAGRTLGYGMKGVSEKAWIYDITLLTGLSKEDLLKMHRNGDIVLSRMDLGQAYPRYLVDRSQVDHMGTSYHMVNLTDSNL